MEIVLSDYQDQLVRGLTHRMNNILSLFHGYLGLIMEDRDLDPSAREGLLKIKAGAQSASDLMERTNGLARPASKVWRETSLCDLLRQLRPTFESFCGAKVNIEIECDKYLPRVWVDASRVRMALTELMRNACEAAKKNVKIRVTATEGRAQGDLWKATGTQPEHWLTVTITDDGEGIPADKSAHIYTPFFTTKRSNTAIGLGLAVAMSCAQQLSGVLRHNSRPGETNFELILPSRAAEALAAVA